MNSGRGSFQRLIMCRHLDYFRLPGCSFTKWNGQGGPFSKQAEVVGWDNYRRLLTKPGLTRKNFATSLRNNFYFVLFVVPLQTVVALLLALILNQRRLKGKSFFRTAFYMPSVSSAVAVVLIFLYLFTSGGAVNSVLGWFGVDKVSWLGNGRGVFHSFLSNFGVHKPPAWLADREFLGLSWWNWVSGPSWMMLIIITMAVWTTSGTFMLMLLAGLQNVPDDVHEAAAMDGAGRWQTTRLVTLPLLWVGLILNLWSVFTPLPDAVIGAVIGYLLLWGVYWLFKLATGKEGMGYGDFKLLAALGAWFGWQALPGIILLSSVVGAVVGIGLMVLARRGREVPMPFGPYLAGAGLLTLYFGRPIAAYFGLA